MTSFFYLKKILRGIMLPSLLLAAGVQGIQAQELVSEEADLEMSVLLMTTGYQSYYHPEVVLEIDGEPVTIAYDSPAFSNGDIVFRPRREGESIRILSIERAQGNPSYKGTLTLRRKEAGILIINDLYMEDYLCGVVPSEMPSYYEEEALKAQAVCARTYAYRQCQEQRLAEYGADVDDSVSFQVYNNIGEQEAATCAVRDTEGEILCQNGSPIEAYYFSTSSGNTSTDEVWESEEEASYLKSVECMYDASEPWSKWQVFFPIERIQNLAEQKFGIQDTVQGMAAVKLSSGGAVTQLRIYTDSGEETVHKEYAIRSFLSPYGLDITQNDGSVSSFQTTLPSAYFSLQAYYDEETGAIAGYTLYGGGYGHGVGMSQNGANHMAAQGSSYGDILNYFFNQVELTSIQTLAQN